jgi:hypothetical protein
MAGCMNQVVDCLPSKRETLNSNPSNSKNKKKNSTTWYFICSYVRSYRFSLYTFSEILFFKFLVVFKLRTTHLLGGCPTSRATLPALLCVGCFSK